MPEIEADCGVLITEPYNRTEGEPIITRRATVFGIDFLRRACYYVNMEIKGDAL